MLLLAPSYLRPSILQQITLVCLPKLVPEAAPSAAACPSLARPLAVVLVQGATLRNSESVGEAKADSATGPPYLCPSILQQGALVCLTKLVPEAAPSAAACPSFARPLAVILVQGATLRHP